MNTGSCFALSIINNWVVYRVSISIEVFTAKLYHEVEYDFYHEIDYDFTDTSKK